MSEAKLDSFFPIEHLKISGFSTPFRRDLDQYGAGLHDIVREDMPAKHLSSESTPIGGMYIKLNLRKKTGCCAVLTIPTISKITNHLDVLRRSLGLYSTKYDNLMVIGDLNVEVNQECMKVFCETYDLSSLIKVPAFYKNLS